MESTAKPLEMNNNNSVTFEEKNAAPQRMVTKLDGTQVPFEKSKLKAYLAGFLDGLNKEFLNLDIVVEKVASGLYNGKYSWTLGLS